MIAENFPELENNTYQEIPNRQDYKKSITRFPVTLSKAQRKVNSKNYQRKTQVTFKGIKIRLTKDSSAKLSRSGRNDVPYSKL